MDPAKKAGNKEPQGKQSRGEFLGWGTPGPAQILTLPCCLSLSPMLRPPARNVLGLQEARRQEKPPEWLRGHRGFPLLGCVDQVLGQSRAGQGSRGGGCRRWQQREVAILLLLLPEYPLQPSPHGLGHLGMQALVGDEVGALLEALVALSAAEGPLASVHTPVVQQVGAQREALAAVAAAEGLLPRVDALVVRQVGAAAEALAALRAGKGLLARVHALVAHQVRGAAETLFALLALVGLLACVRALVARQV